MTAEINLFNLKTEAEQSGRASSSIQERAKTARNEAVSKWNEFEKQRKAALKKILQEKNLGVCIKCLSDNSEGKKIPALYPISELRIVSQLIKDSQWVEIVRYFCPDHFPKKPLNKWEQSGTVEALYSEVIEEDGKLIRVYDKVPITKSIEMIFTEEMYKEFGFPEKVPYPL